MLYAVFLVIWLSVNFGYTLSEHRPDNVFWESHLWPKMHRRSNQENRAPSIPYLGQLWPTIQRRTNKQHAIPLCQMFSQSRRSPNLVNVLDKQEFTTKPQASLMGGNEFWRPNKVHYDTLRRNQATDTIFWESHLWPKIQRSNQGKQAIPSFYPTYGSDQKYSMCQMLLHRRRPSDLVNVFDALDRNFDKYEFATSKPLSNEISQNEHLHRLGADAKTVNNDALKNDIMLRTNVIHDNRFSNEETVKQAIDEEMEANNEHFDFWCNCLN